MSITSQMPMHVSKLCDAPVRALLAPQGTATAAARPSNPRPPAAVPAALPLPLLHHDNGRIEYIDDLTSKSAENRHAIKAATCIFTMSDAPPTCRCCMCRPEWQVVPWPVLDVLPARCRQAARQRLAVHSVQRSSARAGLRCLCDKCNAARLLCSAPERGGLNVMEPTWQQTFCQTSLTNR